MIADDAMAIFLALQSPEVEVIGITTIFGNVYTTLATKNALHLVSALEFWLDLKLCSWFNCVFVNSVFFLITLRSCSELLVKSFLLGSVLVGDCREDRYSSCRGITCDHHGMSYFSFHLWG